MSWPKYSKLRDFLFSLSPWILAAACLLLFFVLTLFTVNNYQREKKLMVEALTQKGMTIIRFINSSTRESMRANLRGAQDLLAWEEHAQAAMEQAVEQPGVDYVALIGLDNYVITGAGQGVLKKQLDNDAFAFLKTLRDNRSDSIVLRDVVSNPEGKRSFQVAGVFRIPGESRHFPGMAGGRSGGRKKMMYGSGRQFIFDHFAGEMARLAKVHPVLLVQLRFEEFSNPLRRQVLQMAILFVVFLLVAIGSYLSLLTLRGLRGSRVRLGRVEKELQRSERLAALGKMAAGVAHELRNPLSSIKGLALLLQSKSKDDKDGVETASILVQEVERLNRSIGELLDYAKPAKLNKIMLDINALVKKIILLIKNDMEVQNIALQLNLADSLPTIEGDEDKLNQVFLNLFLNSIQAMEHGGTLTVRSYRQGKNVAVAIEDTGCGVVSENLQKAFDPYFTTKNDGTGLGLAMSAKIVEEHDGKITLTSQVGEGAKVEVVLPEAEERKQKKVPL